MKIKKDDNVKMSIGKDRGKTGKVLRVLPKERKVVVEGLNLVKRHVKPRKQGQKGQVISTPRAVDVSDVTLICSKCNKPTRIGYQIEGKRKVRVCKKCKGFV